MQVLCQSGAPANQRFERSNTHFGAPVHGAESCSTQLKAIVAAVCMHRVHYLACAHGTEGQRLLPLRAFDASTCRASCHAHQLSKWDMNNSFNA